MRKILFSGILLTICSIYALGQGNKEHTTIVNVKEKTTIEEFAPPPPPTKSCIPNNAFGLDLGIGAIHDEEGLGTADRIPTFDLGLRYLHNFLPYFGVDFFKFNNKFSYKNGFSEYPDQSYFGYNFQLMMGVRGNSPTFAKCMHGYGAFRLGYGGNVEYISAEDYYYGSYDTWLSGSGFCFEFEFGLNITRTFFVAYAFNHQGGTRSVFESDLDIIDMKFPISVTSHAFRIGFNFGK